MARQIVQVESNLVTIAPDDPPPPIAQRYWALASVQLIDELTGQPPLGEIRVTSDVKAAHARAADGGIAVVIGIPQRAFPKLATTSYAVQVRAEVDGFVPIAVTITVPVDA